MKKQISNTVLMTGAGYTNNFGGILAKDMRDKIRYHPEQDRVRSLILILFSLGMHYTNISLIY